MNKPIQNTSLNKNLGDLSISDLLCVFAYQTGWKYWQYFGYKALPDNTRIKRLAIEDKNDIIGALIEKANNSTDENLTKRIIKGILIIYDTGIGIDSLSEENIGQIENLRGLLAFIEDLEELPNYGIKTQSIISSSSEEEVDYTLRLSKLNIKELIALYAVKKGLLHFEECLQTKDKYLETLENFKAYEILDEIRNQIPRNSRNSNLKVKELLDKIKLHTSQDEEGEIIMFSILNSELSINIMDGKIENDLKI